MATGDVAEGICGHPPHRCAEPPLVAREHRLRCGWVTKTPRRSTARFGDRPERLVRRRAWAGPRGRRPHGDIPRPATFGVASMRVRPRVPAMAPVKSASPPIGAFGDAGQGSDTALS